MDDIRAGRWLVGIDGSDPSLRALEWALVNASPATEVVAAASWLPPVMDRPTHALVNAGEETEAAEDRLREYTRRLIASAAHAGRSRVEVVVLRGGASEALLDEAERSSLLILGKRGHGGFGRLLLGSVSAQCATHAVVPTVIVPDVVAPVRVSSVLVAFDGSPNSVDALTAAVSFAEPGCPIVALGVDETASLLVGYPDLCDDVHIERDRVHADAFEAALRRFGGGQTQVERRFEVGAPGDVLADATRHHDLLVLGARGHGPIVSAVLGSVSSRLLHHVETPTMVVPHDRTPGE